MSDVEGLGKRRGRRRLLFWGIVGAIVLAAAGWAVVNQPWTPKPTKVATETVTSGPASRVLAVNGRVIPAQQVEISSTVNGRVDRVDVDEGDVIASGATMLVLDDTQQAAAVAQAQSSLDAAQTRLAQAEMDFERAKGLGDSIAQKALDDARFAVETARNEVERLTALRDQAQNLRDDYTVRAPFDGTVLSRGADPGQVVNSSSSLFLFADLSNLLAEASVDEVYASEVRRGLAVTARPAGHTGNIEGEVTYVSPRVDSSTGGRIVRVALPGAGGMGMPVGLTVTLNIVVEERDEAITIPRAALINGPDPAIFKIVGGKAVRQPVQYIDWPSERLIVSEGLAAGDLIIADSSGIAEGALVAAKE